MPGAIRTLDQCLMGPDAGLAPTLPNFNGRQPTNRTCMVLLNPSHHTTHLTESDKGHCSTTELQAHICGLRIPHNHTSYLSWPVIFILSHQETVYLSLFIGNQYYLTLGLVVICSLPLLVQVGRLELPASTPQMSPSSQLTYTWIYSGSKNKNGDRHHFLETHH